MHEIWPNFFLVGAAKAGTTSIYAYLSEHPQVFFPAIKEPHFFTQVRPSRELQFLIEAISKRSAYLRLYASAAGHQIIGDASPSYLWHPEVPERIRAEVPQAKIAIFCVTLLKGLIPIISWTTGRVRKADPSMRR